MISLFVQKILKGREKAEAIIEEEIQEMQEALERRKKFLEVKNEEQRVKNSIA